MSVATSISRISHVGNNSTSTAYVVPFPFALDGDLVVVKTLTATGAETTLALSSDYSVTGAGVPAGGSIVTVAAIPATYTVTIYRQVTLIQPLEYEEADEFPASSHEGALDRLTYMAQQDARSVVGSFRLRESDGELGPFMLVKSAVVGTDAGGNATMLDGADIQAMLNLPATVIDQPTKTLANDAARAAAVPDFLGQLATQLDTNGTYVGTAITAGSWVHTLVLDDSVTTAKILNANVTAAKLASTLDLSGKTITFPPSLISSQTAITTTDDADYFLIWDHNDSSLKRVSRASLASAFSPSGAVVKTVYAENDDWTTSTPLTSTTFALDGTIPQLSSDGGTVITASITPASGNKILIRATGMVTTDAAYCCGGLFRNTTEDAIHAWAFNVPGSATFPGIMSMEFMDATPSVGVNLYTVKIGAYAATAVYVNGTATTHLFGGAAKWTITLQEIKA